MKRMIMSLIFRCHPLRRLYLAILFLCILCVPIQASAEFIFPKSETIHYDIKKLKLKVGEADFVYKGLNKTSDGRDALLLLFTARGFKFLDEEKIYLDPETFHPMVVERNVNIFGKKEKIVEHYDPHKGEVRVVKTYKGKTEEQKIKNGKRFDNIYGFIYRYRKLGAFKEGENFQIHLPTCDVNFKLDSKEQLNIGKKQVETYVMKSDHKKYKVWFDSGDLHVPVRINGALSVGSTSMIIRVNEE